MDATQLQAMVWQLIDANCMEMGKEEYADMLEEIAGDARIRAEAVRDEIDAQGEE